MKIADIIKMESECAETSLNLVKEGKFWRAYEGSAHLFYHHIQNYHIVKRYFKNVKSELVFLGFPESVLATCHPRERGDLCFNT